MGLKAGTIDEENIKSKKSLDTVAFKPLDQFQAEQFSWDAPFDFSL